MCNLNTTTNLKQQTVFKVVYKTKDGYKSCFAKSKVVIGKVIPQTERPKDGIYYKAVPSLFNELAVGRSSGFEKLEIATILAATYGSYSNICILKIELGGSIVSGTALGIMNHKYDREIVYAGTEILSIEEVG